MNPEQIMLIQTSFVLVMPAADSVAALFYQRLFELDPALRPMFRGDIQEQGRKLMSMLKLAVNSLSHLDQLVPALEHLGRRHACYGVRDQHYDTVAAALLWTLEQGLGKAFTPEVEQAWATAYTLLADTMKAATTMAEAA